MIGYTDKSRQLLGNVCYLNLSTITSRAADNHNGVMSDGLDAALFIAVINQLLWLETYGKQHYSSALMPHTRRSLYPPPSPTDPSHQCDDDRPGRPVYPSPPPPPPPSPSRRYNDAPPGGRPTRSPSPPPPPPPSPSYQCNDTISGGLLYPIPSRPVNPDPRPDPRREPRAGRRLRDGATQSHFIKPQPNFVACV